jgi:hypothetical protein
MTCPICHGLGKTSTCLLGTHCSCPDGAACGNATSHPCECQGIDADLAARLSVEFDRAFEAEFGAAVQCAVSANEVKP